MLRQLRAADASTVARVHRMAFDDALPWLAGLHTPDEDLWFFRERMFPRCTLWGEFSGDELVGFIAFREDWIDQLYVLPHHQRGGIGGRLLRIAQSAWPRLDLWTFQRNLRARRFYASHGFILVEETDGARNEEKEPDARYRWTR